MLCMSQQTNISLSFENRFSVLSQLCRGKGMRDVVSFQMSLSAGNIKLRHGQHVAHEPAQFGDINR